MVFQSYALYPHMTVFENIAYSMKLKKVPKKEIKERVHEVAQILKIEEILDRKPGQLSGGQKQRVAIARALATEPSILLADEPTGALDSGTGRMVMDLFHKVHEEQGKTIVFITHNNELAEETERIVTLRDGNIVSDEYNNKFYRRYSDGEQVCL